MGKITSQPTFPLLRQPIRFLVSCRFVKENGVAYYEGLSEGGMGFVRHEAVVDKRSEAGLCRKADRTWMYSTLQFEDQNQKEPEKQTVSITYAQFTKRDPIIGIPPRQGPKRRYVVFDSAIKWNALQTGVRDVLKHIANMYMWSCAVVRTPSFYYSRPFPCHQGQGCVMCDMGDD